MHRRFSLPILAMGLVAVAPLCASAKPVYTTKYTYYSIGGDTAAEIYNAMIRRGPHVNGAQAYASTSATSSQEGKLAQGQSCAISDYRLRIDFVIRLPRIKNEKVLSGATRARWQQFSRFLKQHEETHRSIWLVCARDLERQVKAIAVADCGIADARAAKLWEQMRKSCTKKHDAFDAAEQKRLARHPFVKLVLKQSDRTSNAAAVPVTKK
ncbi:MAG: DUF922 domain-containing protein [Hyphomicrobiales bacterium]